MQSLWYVSNTLFILCVCFFQPSDDDTISLHSQVSESNREQTSRNDSHTIGSKPDAQKGNLCGVCYSYFIQISFIKNGFWKIIVSLSNSSIKKINFIVSTSVSEYLQIYFKVNTVLYLDQEVYDFIDPNTEDVTVPEQGDTHMGPFVSFLKVNKAVNKYS